MLSLALAAPIPAATAAELVPFTEHPTIAFTGNGTTSTRPFNIKHEWEIQWEKTGEWPSVELFMVQVTEKGNPLPVAAWNLAGRAGTSYVPKTGEFYLQITAMGPWKISVVELSR
ncbi:MAG: hypothetical protein AB7T38_02685 [Nitrospirales bacterium]